MTHNVYHKPQPRNLSADEEAQYHDELAQCYCPEHRPDMHDSSDEPSRDGKEAA